MVAVSRIRSWAVGVHFLDESSQCGVFGLYPKMFEKKCPHSHQCLMYSSRYISMALHMMARLISTSQSTLGPNVRWQVSPPVMQNEPSDPILDTRISTFPGEPWSDETARMLNATSHGEQLKKVSGISAIHMSSSWDGPVEGRDASMERKRPGTVIVDAV